MDLREKPEKPLRILFVCLANVCRSPLAKSIARRCLGGRIETESAGIVPPMRMLPDAAEMLGRLTGEDFSTHRPRFVLDLPVDEFDYIIGMDSSVFMRLSTMPSIPKDKLYGWEISDPCGQGPETYARTARQIEQHLEQFLFNREIEKTAPRKKRPG